MTKILMITLSFYPAFLYGGPIFSSYELAKSLKKTFVDFRVITTNANGNEKLTIKIDFFHNMGNGLSVKYYYSLNKKTLVSYSENSSSLFITIKLKLNVVHLLSCIE